MVCSFRVFSFGHEPAFSCIAAAARRLKDVGITLYR